VGGPVGADTVGVIAGFDIGFNINPSFKLGKDEREDRKLLADTGLELELTREGDEIDVLAEQELEGTVHRVVKEGKAQLEIARGAIKEALAAVHCAKLTSQA